MQKLEQPLYNVFDIEAFNVYNIQFTLESKCSYLGKQVGVCFVHLKMNNELPTQYLSNVHVYPVIHCNSLYSASLYIYSLLGPVTSLPILLGTNLDLRPISFAYSDKQPLPLCSVVWTEFVCQTGQSNLNASLDYRSSWYRDHFGPNIMYKLP